ncbi:MAG TPA: SMI1/KNR4 family protein [Terriglobales bacterium]|nr:SMI1/KNR4 family protein [Terriglobales bacterium]
MIDKQFLVDFKRITEAKWATQEINPTIFGFQFQRGTKWRPGLSDVQITAYESAIGVQFPDDLRTFLREMNGTDLPTVNIYGSGGAPERQSVGVYSYPRDLELVRDRIDIVREHRAAIANDLASQGFDLGGNSDLVPIYIHRYVVATQNLSSSVVLSIVVNDVDAIVYGNSLQEYLAKEFLST